MADDKKGPPKKDDKKPAGGGGMAPDFKLLLVGIAVFVVVTYMATGRGLFEPAAEPPSLAEVAGRFTAPDHLTAGDTVANTAEVIVRRDLQTAEPIGRQASGVRGVLGDGPEEAYDRLWWFVDYPSAPDGWVDASLLTDRLVAVAAENAPSFVVQSLRPIFVVAAFVIAALIALMWWRKRELEQISEAKAAEARRAYFASRGIAEPKTELADAEIPDGAPAGSLPGAGDLPDWLKGDRNALGPSRPSEPERWKHAKALLTSTSQSDWRQSIIEADIILEEMLRAIGYDGVSIGDMLKNVEPSDFATLDDAWEAHKVRNHIAHRGSDFTLTRQEADRVLKLFENVFREFHYI